MKKILPILTLLTALILLSGCKATSKRLPNSSGRPYEVAVEGDSDSILTKMLMTDVPSLPQPEPMFDIIKAKKGQYPTMRLRISLSINTQWSTVAVKRGDNVKANPQTLIQIQAPSTEALRTYLSKDNSLLQLCNQVELQHLASVIKQNPEKQKEVKRLFGIEMKIPVSMNSSKQGKDFLWLSNNANTGMQSLLFFRLPCEKKQRTRSFMDYISTSIDSVLKINMPGEEDGMYMKIATSEMYLYSDKTERYRGLWEMEGDAMGGPYVLQVKVQGDYYVVVMGFVYAPEMKKRNLTKQLEAVLTTIGKESTVATK